MPAFVKEFVKMGRHVAHRTHPHAKALPGEHCEMLLSNLNWKDVSHILIIISVLE